LNTDNAFIGNYKSKTLQNFSDIGQNSCYFLKFS